MKTSFDYIDDVVEKSTKAEPVLSDKERGDAEKKGKKIIGGFRVRDPDEEKRALDSLVAKKRAGVEAFLRDRAKAKEVLNTIKPMAIVPTKAWEKICYDTGLYIMAPNKQGMVGYDHGKLQSLSGWSEKAIDAKAKADWKWFLDLAFPQRKAPIARQYYAATLILPDPPEAVATILCKAQALPLKVAAVAEAISFVEKPSEIVKRSSVNPKDLWAQAQGYEDYKDWVKRDPIVFYECGTATAIIAQFGDFPIEKEVVDAVMATNDLLPEGISPPVQSVLMPETLEDMYRRTMQIANGQMGIARQYPNLFGQAQEIGSYTPTMVNSVMPTSYTISSSGWTGRNW